LSPTLFELPAATGAAHEGLTATTMNGTRGILLVEPDVEARDRLRLLLGTSFPRVCGVSTAADALGRLGLGFDILLLNIELPEAAARDVLQAAFALRVAPIIVLMGHAPAPSLVFELARAGARAYLEHPLDVQRLLACTEPGDLRAELQRLVRPLLGRIGLKQIQSHVRQALMAEAFLRAGGSRRSAAQLLCVTRPAIQKWLRESHAGEPAISNLPQPGSNTGM
jgi:DNA-binding response OmpR family regulator